MRDKRNDMIFHTAGGRLPFGVLRRVAELAMVHGNGHLSAGSRQELVIEAIHSESRDRVRRELGGLLAEHHPKRPNIVTTRPVAGRARRTPWLNDGAYDAVLSQFVTAPAIPVSFSDPQQAYLPLYTGQINFLAAPEPGYWRIHFNMKGLLRPTLFSTAVHNDGVPAATFVIQQALLRDGGIDLPVLQHTLEECLAGLTREIAPATMPPLGDARPIEGFVLDAQSDVYTLGIPMHSQPLSGEFLVDLALAAHECGLATAGFTPWRSLLVHGIPRSGRGAFEQLLLRHRVRTNAIGWDSVFFLDARSAPVLAAAEALLQALGEAYPHPGALRLSLTDHPHCVPDTPVVVRAEIPAASWPFNPKPRFSVYLRENADRLNPMLLPCADRVSADRLAGAVLDVVARCANGGSAPASAAPARLQGAVLLHQCAECRTEYSEQYGDPLGGIVAGTPFEELPATWSCPTCGAPQAKYITTRGHAA